MSSKSKDLEPFTSDSSSNNSKDSLSLQDPIWISLTEVFHNTFDDPTIEISANTTAADIDQWDSLTHVQLIVAVEAKFAIRFKHTEIAQFENVQDMVNAINRHMLKAS